jgi:predicted nucleic acid-binding protein
VIFVDTGAWFASMVPSDANHDAAEEWLNQNSEPLITTDYVVSETITLLLVRGQRPQAEAFGSMILGGKLASLHVIELGEIQNAWEVFLRFQDKQWSFTDCTSKVIIEKLGLTKAFSFDHHFRQFGTVTVVP